MSKHYLWSISSFSLKCLFFNSGLISVFSEKSPFSLTDLYSLPYLPFTLCAERLFYILVPAVPRAGFPQGNLETCMKNVDAYEAGESIRRTQTALLFLASV